MKTELWKVAAQNCEIEVLEGLTITQKVLDERKPALASIDVRLDGVYVHTMTLVWSVKKQCWAVNFSHDMVASLGLVFKSKPNIKAEMFLNAETRGNCTVISSVGPTAPACFDTDDMKYVWVANHLKWVALPI